MQGAHGLDQRIPVLLRHADVREQHVHRATPEEIECLSSGGCHRHSRTLHLEERSQHLPRIRLVVHEQYLQTRQRPYGWFFRNGLVDTPTNGAHGQVNGERRAETFTRTLCGHRSAVRLGEVPHDGETQPQPAMAPGGRAVGLSEALEHVLEKIVTNALAGISDDD